jgi:nucleoside-diphosphate-sugar epimerase
MEILVSGARSGLGKYLKRLLKSDEFNRDCVIDEFKFKKYDVIIHCAYDFTAEVNEIESNTELTRKLLGIEHKHFIYISSVDVYPSKSIGSEDLNISYLDLNNDYSISKLMSESLVKLYGIHPLILRPSVMLGLDMRENSLLKMFSKGPSVLTLSSNSSFNYVLHEDVGSFIEHCITNKIVGIYNVASKKNITLIDIKDEHELHDIGFGKYFYETTSIDSSKIITEYPIFKKSSRQVIQYFINNILRKK